MRRLSLDLSECMASFSVSDEASRKARRAAEVNTAWRRAVEKVYQGAASFILSHVNAVYIMREDACLLAVIYADDSLVRSDIDARQEFLKMALAEQGERVDVFRIIASRFGMKQRHPFDEKSSDDTELSRMFEPAVRTPLSAEQERSVDECVSVVENLHLREKLRRAMTAEMEHQSEKR